MINKVCTSLILIVMSLFVFYFVPYELVFSDQPATGGDTGSHFWPVKILAEYGLPNLKVHLWNPGNLGGEPLFYHYFPLPFIIMALMGQVIPIEMAFNLGTLLGIIFLPYSIYFCTRSFGYNSITALFTALFSLVFIYNESFSMFGGNTLSTLAGQFSHGYALCFFFIAVGFYIKHLQKNKFSFWGAIFFAFTAFSHAYLFIITPIVFISALLVLKKSKEVWIKNIIYGLGILLLTSWFIFPMLQNQAWTTPLPMTFGSGAFLNFVKDQIFIGFISISIPVFLFSIYRMIKIKGSWDFKFHLFWIPLIAAYIVLFFIFPKVGLVDVRALPQIMIFGIMLLSLFWGKAIDSIHAPNITKYMLILSLLFTSFWWIDKHVYKFPHWANWNYSSWKAKKIYPALDILNKNLKGDLAEPRVIFEQHDKNSTTGTIRVFEMMPYFTNRSTSESLYTQATVYSPYAFYMQARISLTPSCPFGNLFCGETGFHGLEAKLNLLGMDTLILVSQDIKNLANNEDFLFHDFTSEPWAVYRTKNQVFMIDIIDGNVDIEVDSPDWKEEASFWFLNNKTYERPIIFVNSQDEKNELISKFELAQEKTYSDCEPLLSVDFEGFDISTSCPNQPHFIKFAYHPTWKANTNDKIYLISPGMMLVFPSSNKIRFNFGDHWVLELSLYTTLAIFLIMLILYRKKFLV